MFIENEIAQKIVPVEIKPGLSLSTVTGTLSVKDNVHNVEVCMDVCWSTIMIIVFVEFQRYW